MRRILILLAVLTSPLLASAQPPTANKASPKSVAEMPTLNPLRTISPALEKTRYGRFAESNTTGTTFTYKLILVGAHPAIGFRMDAADVAANGVLPMRVHTLDLTGQLRNELLLLTTLEFAQQVEFAKRSDGRKAVPAEVTFQVLRYDSEKRRSYAKVKAVSFLDSTLTKPMWTQSVDENEAAPVRAANVPPPIAAPPPPKPLPTPVNPFIRPGPREVPTPAEPVVPVPKPAKPLPAPVDPVPEPFAFPQAQDAVPPEPFAFPQALDAAKVAEVVPPAEQALPVAVIEDNTLVYVAGGVLLMLIVVGTIVAISLSNRPKKRSARSRGRYREDDDDEDDRPRRARRVRDEDDDDFDDDEPPRRARRIRDD